MAKPIKSAAAATAKYQQGIQQGAAAWAQGIQGYNGESPMTLAAAQKDKALANFSAVLNNSGPDGWVQRLMATPVSLWKSGAASGQAKYAMAKGTAKWNRYFAGQGTAIATAMRQESEAGKAAGVDGITRSQNALRKAQSMGRRGGG